MFFRLLWESFRRQRRRKLLAGVAILLGTTAVTAMLALATTIGDRIHRELAVYGANLVITPAASGLDVNVGGLDIRPATGNAYLKESDLEKLKGIFWANNITGVSPELDVPLSVTDLTKDPQAVHEIRATLMGAWFDHKFGSITTGINRLNPLWRINGRWPRACPGTRDVICDGPEVVISSGLATRLGWHIGDNVALSGFGSKRLTPTELVGIVNTGDEAQEVLVDLADAHAFFGTHFGDDSVSRVEVSARTRPEDAFARKDPEALSPHQREIWYCRPYANSIAFQIREAIPGADAEQVRRVEQSEGNVLKRISGLMWLVSLAALVAAGFAVSAAMATAILERRGEIGLLRSLGASRGAVAALFYVEAAILAVVAGSVGFLAGSGLAFWLGHRIFPGEAAGAVLNPVLLPVVVGLALLVAMAGSTPAIRQALKMDPSAVLRAGA